MYQKHVLLRCLRKKRLSVWFVDFVIVHPRAPDLNVAKFIFERVYNFKRFFCSSVALKPNKSTLIYGGAGGAFVEFDSN